MMFPNATAELLFIMAFTETINSGMEVPKPTMTKQLKKGETLSLFAADMAPRIKSSPPMININSPAIIII